MFVDLKCRLWGDERIDVSLEWGKTVHSLLLSIDKRNDTIKSDRVFSLRQGGYVAVAKIAVYLQLVTVGESGLEGTTECKFTGIVRPRRLSYR
jgi:hypothetical protein